MQDDRFLNDPVMRCVYNTIIVNNDLDNTTKLVDKLVQALYAEELELNKNISASTILTNQNNTHIFI